MATVPVSGCTRTGNSGSVRFGVLEFPASLLHAHESPDVTEKFGKFELPVTRLSEGNLRLLVDACCKSFLSAVGGFLIVTKTVFVLVTIPPGLKRAFPTGLRMEVFNDNINTIVK